MALDDINGYKAFWHPYEDCILPYRLLFPYGYDADPTNGGQGYPLLVWLQGSGEAGVDNIYQVTSSWSLAAGYNNTLPSYSRNKMFVLIPHIPIVCPELWSQSIFNTDVVKKYIGQRPTCGDFYEQLIYKNVSSDWSCIHGWINFAIDDLVRKIINKNNNFCDNVVKANESEPVPVIWILGEVSSSYQQDQLNIDLNKVYISGSSLGGFGAMKCILTGRDIYAAALIFQGFPYSPMISIYDENEQDYDIEKSIRLEKELERILHIPILFSTSSNDTNTGIKPVNDYLFAYNKISELHNKQNPALFINPGALGHSITVTNNIFDTSKKFDPNIHIMQDYGDTGVCGIDWVLSQNKNDTPIDPYSGQELNYYPERLLVFSYKDELKEYDGNRIYYRLLGRTPYVCSGTWVPITLQENIRTEILLSNTSPVSRACVLKKRGNMIEKTSFRNSAII